MSLLITGSIHSLIFLRGHQKELTGTIMRMSMMQGLQISERGGNTKILSLVQDFCPWNLRNISVYPPFTLVWLSHLIRLANDAETLTPPMRGLSPPSPYPNPRTTYGGRGNHFNYFGVSFPNVLPFQSWNRNWLKCARTAEQTVVGHHFRLSVVRATSGAT